MLTVRPALPAEYGAVAEVTVAAYRADGQLDEDNRYESRLRSGADRARDREGRVGWDGAGVGVGGVTLGVPDSDLAGLSVPGEAEFRMLGVAPPAQRRGVRPHSSASSKMCGRSRWSGRFPTE